MDNICREKSLSAGRVTCGVRNETSGVSWPPTSLNCFVEKARRSRRPGSQRSLLRMLIVGALKLIYWYGRAACTPLVISLAKRFPLTGPRLTSHVKQPFVALSVLYSTGEPGFKFISVRSAGLETGAIRQAQAEVTIGQRLQVANSGHLNDCRAVNADEFLRVKTPKAYKAN